MKNSKYIMMAALIASSLLYSEQSMAMKAGKTYKPTDGFVGKEVTVNSEKKIVKGIEGDITVTPIDSVYAGYSEGDADEVKDNKLTLDQIENIDFYASGAYGFNLINNSVIINGVDDRTTISKSIIGGRAGKEAKENKIIGTNIFGVQAELCGGDEGSIARNNTVDLTGSSSGMAISNYSITGGKGYELAEGNKVFLKNTRNLSMQSVVGGEGEVVERAVAEPTEGIARNNEVHITGGGEYPIMSQVEVSGGKATNLAEGNIVTIDGMDGLYNTDITGGTGSLAKGNHLRILNVKEILDDGEDHEFIDGGCGTDEGSEDKALENKLEIIGTDEIPTFLSQEVTGGTARIEASKNTVLLKNVVLKNTKVLGGQSFDGTSSENEVILWNVKDSEESDRPSLIFGGAGEEITKNTITLVGNTDVESVILAGGERMERSQTMSGNILNIGLLDDEGAHPWISSNKNGNIIYSNEIHDIDTVKFTAVDWNPKKAAITFINPHGAAPLQNRAPIPMPKETDLSALKVDASKIVFVDKDELINVGAEMTLIDVEPKSSDDKAIKQENITSGTFTVGTVFKGEGEAVVNEEHDVVYQIKQKGEGEGPENPENSGKEPTLEMIDQTHNAVIGQTASLAAVAAGQNFVEAGLSSGRSFFMASSAGRERYQTGSHIDTKVANAIVGLGNTSGNLDYMSFFEYGGGSYKVKNDSGRTGKGDLSYQAVAVAGRYHFPDNIYTEASAKIGRVKNDAKDVLTDASGKGYDYKTSGTYFAGHLGLGKVFAVSETTNLDAFTKFRYTNIEKDHFKAGGDYKLDAIHSYILSLGANIQQDWDAWKLRYGLALEHEFDGKSKGSADGDKIKSADISGTSVSGNLGLSYARKDSPWSFDMGISGYVGRHRGVRGNLGLAYKF